MMMNPDECPLCDAPPMVRPAANTNGSWVRCSACGLYIITFEALLALRNERDADRPSLSCFVRHHIEQEPANPFTLMRDHVENPVSALGVRRRSVSERIDLSLALLASRSDQFGGRVRTDARNDWTLVWARSPQEYEDILVHLQKRGDLEDLGKEEVEGTVWEAMLSAGGWIRHEAAYRQGRTSRRAFVAMWFDTALTEAWSDGFEPAIRSCGFDPVRIDLKEHNGKICDEIVAEIRSCGLLVADFTGQRGGVYFEAGFALGLGKPVVWTCRADEVDELHFDTRQYNHIVWDTTDSLRKKLESRIRATVPLPKG